MCIIEKDQLWPDFVLAQNLRKIEEVSSVYHPYQENSEILSDRVINISSPWDYYFCIDFL